MQEAEAFRKVHPLAFYRQFLAKNDGVRPDGRARSETRRVNITTDTVSKADGSAMAKLGNTTVVASVRCEVGMTQTETAGAGRIVVNLEMTGLCSPIVRPGRPNDCVAAMSNMIERLMNGADVLEMDALAIEGASGTGRSWVLACDLYCLDYDGNVLDTAIIALTAALCDVKLPDVRMGLDGKVVATGEAPHALQLMRRRLPVPLTYALIDSHAIADPTLDEEKLGGGAIGGAGKEAGATSGNLSVVVNGEGALCAMYRAGGAPLPEETMLRSCIAGARERVPRIMAHAAYLETSEAA